MKLFRFTVGLEDRFHPFEDEKEAYERRSEVDSTFQWLPVVIEELTVEGYTITVTPNDAVEAGDAPKRGGRPRKAAE